MSDKGSLGLSLLNPAGAITGAVMKQKGGLLEKAGLVKGLPDPPPIPDVPEDLGEAGEQRLAQAKEPESAGDAARRRRRQASQGRGTKDTILTSPIGLTNEPATRQSTILGA